LKIDQYVFKPRVRQRVGAKGLLEPAQNLGIQLTRRVWPSFLAHQSFQGPASGRIKLTVHPDNFR